MHARTLFCLAHHVFEINGYIVLGGHPLNLLEQGGNRYGNIAQHKDGEREQVGNDAPTLFRMNPLILANGRKRPNDEEGNIGRRKGHEYGARTHEYLLTGGKVAMAQPTQY